MDGDVPPFLTVEEAGRLLRIGRTKAYELTKEWRATGGRSGLPVIDLGDVLRVPGPAIEQMLGIGLTDPPLPEPDNRRRPSTPGDANAVNSDSRRVSIPTPVTLPTANEPVAAERPRRSRPTNRQATKPLDQLPLFCATEPMTPNPELPLPNLSDPASTPPQHPTS